MISRKLIRPLLPIFFTLTFFNIGTLNAQTNVYPTNGNVGIGTTTPATKLHVVGGDPWPILTIGDGTTNNQIKFNYLPTGGGDFTSQLAGSDQMSFGFNNTGTWGGTAGSASGRLLYFYDRVTNLYRGGFNASGDFFWGPSASSYSVKLEQPTGALTSLTVKNNGYVGIGTSNPNNRLHVAGDVQTDGYYRINYPLNSGGGLLGMSGSTNLMQMGFNAQAQYGGTLGAVSGSQFFVYNFQEALGGTNSYYWGFNNTGDNFWGSSNSLYSVKVQQPRAANVPLSILGVSGQTANLFNITASGGLTGGVLSVLPNGNIGIGTANPKSLLAVKGQILAQKVRVSIASSEWSDYVFDKSYQLPSLETLEEFIQAHKHLPEIPSATEVEKEGIDLATNQALLLKKIEELTLYVIDINKKLKSLSNENEELKKELGR